MQRQQDMEMTGVRERCVAEAGATALLRNSRVGCAALVAPASARNVSRKYRLRIFHRSALDTSQIK